MLCCCIASCGAALQAVVLLIWLLCLALLLLSFFFGTCQAVMLVTALRDAVLLHCKLWCCIASCGAANLAAVTGPAAAAAVFLIDIHCK